MVEAETPRKGGRPILMLMEHFGGDVKGLHACVQDSGVGVVKERELLGVLAPLLFEVVQCADSSNSLYANAKLELQKV